MMEATDRQTGRSADEPTREKDRGSGITLDECETLEQVLACMRVLSSFPHVKLSRKFATENRATWKLQAAGEDAAPLVRHTPETCGSVPCWRLGAARGAENNFFLTTSLTLLIRK